jgi:hypothetical protein
MRVRTNSSLVVNRAKLRLLVVISGISRWILDIPKPFGRVKVVSRLDNA